MSTVSQVLVKQYLKGRSILHEDPNDRSGKKNEYLKTWLLDYVPFFKTIPEGDLHLILENMTLESYKTRELVFEQEDYNQKFYIVLRGTVAALIDTSSLHRMFYTSNADSDKRMIRPLCSLPLTHQKSIARKERTMIRHTHSTELWRMTKGDHFGQESLISKEGKSLYSVRCLEHTELLVVDGSDFDETLKPYFHKLFFDRTKLLYGMGLFHNCSLMSIRILALLLRETKFHIGECLYRQKMHCNSIRIIGSGSVKISSDFSQKASHELMQKVRPPKDHLREILMADKPKGSTKTTTRNVVHYSARGISKKRHSSGNSLVTMHRKMAPLSGHARVRTSHHKKKKNDCSDYKVMGFILHQPSTQLPNTHICTLGQGDMLGDIECITKLSQHLFSGVCTASTTIYEINFALFEAALAKKVAAIAHQIVERSIEKVTAWQCAHPSIQCFGPLVSVLSQIKNDFEEDGVHKHIRKRPKNETPESLALACSTKGLDIQISETNSEASAQFPVPGMPSLSDENSLSSAILSQLDFSLAHIDPDEAGELLEAKNDGLSLQVEEDEVSQSEPQMLQSAMDETTLEVEADLNYYPPLYENRAMKERKKRLYSFDVAVPFGKITRNNNSKQSLQTQGSGQVSEKTEEKHLRGPVDSIEVQKPTIKFEDGNPGKEKAKKCTHGVESCARSSLAKVRYDVIYNKEKSLKQDDSFNILTTEFVRNGLTRPLHKLIPDLPRPSVATTMLAKRLSHGQHMVERIHSGASVSSIDDKFEPIREVLQIRNSHHVRGDCVKDVHFNALQKQSSDGPVNVLNLEIGIVRKGSSPEQPLSATKRKLLASSESPRSPLGEDVTVHSFVPHPWTISRVPPKSAPERLSSVYTAQLGQQILSRSIHFSDSKSCSNIVPLSCVSSQTPCNTPLLSPKSNPHVSSRSSAHISASALHGRSNVDIPAVELV